MNRLMTKCIAVLILFNLLVFSYCLAEKITDKPHSYKPNVNDVKSFVYQWYSWFDHQADENLFLRHLSTNKLQVVFPEMTITDHAGFKKWYKGIRETIKWNTHDVKYLKVTGDSKKGFKVEVTVNWKARTYAGKYLDTINRQQWTVSVNSENVLVITNYVVKMVK